MGLRAAATLQCAHCAAAASTMPNSARSGGSRALSSKRSNYKMIAPHSEVDETLFATQQKGRPRSRNEGASYVSKDMMASFSDALVIDGSEYDRLRDAATVRTQEMEQMQAAARKAEQDEKFAVAKARKDKILAMEIERKKKEAKSDLELEAIVKEKNQYVKYAKCAAIRDAQLEEKKALQRQQEE